MTQSFSAAWPCKGSSNLVAGRQIVEGTETYAEKNGMKFVGHSSDGSSANTKIRPKTSVKDDEGLTTDSTVETDRLLDTKVDKSNDMIVP